MQAAARRRSAKRGAAAASSGSARRGYRSVCHCLACQQRTGSAFGVQARFPRENVGTEGAASRYVRTADSGNTITYHFCPACGATVWYRLDRVPEIVAVPVGAFADPDFPPPRFSVWESRRHAWAGVPVDVEHHD